MTFLQAIFLGLLQGLTEFLPVSSSGHLALAQYCLPGFDQPGILFDVLLHLGTMAAVLVFFRREVIALASAPFSRNEESQQNRRLLGLLIAGSVPTAIIGLSFKDTFEQLFARPDLVALMLLVTGTLLAVAERRRGTTRRGLNQISLIDALLIGTAQGLSITPGISRSGATIATGLLRGIDGEAAARFSFLLALPAVFGAALLQLRHLEALPKDQGGVYLAGTLVAFGSGLLALKLLLAVVRNRRLLWFAGYCWLLGISVWLLLP